jgi:hypothetical protein
VVGQLLPIVALCFAVPLSIALFDRFKERLARPNTIAVCILVACLALVPPFFVQEFFDRGLSLDSIDKLNLCCHFVFFVALTGAWILSGSSRKRLLLLVLVPIALLGPLQLAYAFFCWSIGGFAP